MTPESLTGVRFALIGLGDRAYAHFCGGAETLRSALLSAGAEEVAQMVRADGDPTARLARVARDGRRRPRPAARESPASAYAPPVTLRLVDRARLDDPRRGDTRETWAVVLASDLDLAFRPGDLLRIAPLGGGRERPYSIGSSSLVDPRRIELTVRLHRRIDSDGVERLGRVSGELIRWAQIGARMAARIDPHPAFNPPDDPTRPIIMIGAGSGVAPFPGFLAERAASGRPGPAWLLFGNRRRDADFLWEGRWRAALRNGSLTRLDTAFSRDADDGAYVQERLAENAEETRRWLNEGALVYVCGRRDMARDVRETLAAILARDGDASRSKAENVHDAADERIRVDAFD